MIANMTLSFVLFYNLQAREEQAAAEQQQQQWTQIQAAAAAQLAISQANAENDQDDYS